MDGFICVKVPLMQSWMLEFWRDRCCHLAHVFSREIRGYFSRTMPDLILSVCPLPGPALQSTSVSCLNVWSIMKRRTRQQQPRTAEQLESGIQQEWTLKKTLNICFFEPVSVEASCPEGCGTDCPPFLLLFFSFSSASLLLFKDNLQAREHPLNPTLQNLPQVS